MHTKIKLLKIITFMSVFLISANIYSQGHYNGSSFNPNDYFVPPPTGWVFSLYYSYSQMDFHNNNGDVTDHIELNQNPPLSLKIGQKVKTNSIIPIIIYSGKNKIFNAKWGALALPMINNPNANVALDFYTGQSIAGNKTINFNTVGLGDLYLQPLWLTWEGNKIAATFSYGMWIPIGKYEPESTDNVGLGYWSHNLRVAGRYKPDVQFNLVGAVTYEHNTKQKDVDFREAPHVTVDYGASYTFAMGHEAGIFGFGTWQIGDDEGKKAVLSEDKIFGIGAFGSYWFVPGKLGVLSRITNNFGAKNRFGGLSFQIGVNYLLFN